MAAAKNGVGKLATGINGVRTVLQQLIAPELKEHTVILRQHGEARLMA